MGSSDRDLAEQAVLGRDADYYTDDEQPLHPVALTVPYSVAKYETANEQFCAVMNRAMLPDSGGIQEQALTDVAFHAETGFGLARTHDEPDIRRPAGGDGLGGPHVANHVGHATPGGTAAPHRSAGPRIGRLVRFPWPLRATPNLAAAGRRA